MNPSVLLSYWIPGFLLISGLIALGGLLLAIALSKQANPDQVPAMQPHLRPPGESIRHEIRRLEDQRMGHILSVLFTPVVFGGLVIAVGQFLQPDTLPDLAWIGGLGLLVVIIATFLPLRRFGKWAQAYGQAQLDFYGERYVSQFLFPLVGAGYCLFHDVELGSNGKRSHVDHILVGPAGVFVIETRTRRKRGRQAKALEADVTYDGKGIHFPWGEDREGIDQAWANARKVKSLLEDTANIAGFPLYPILALPGWSVDATREFKKPAVISPQQIRDYVLAQPRERLMNTETIRKLALQVEKRNTVSP